jgi:hypothetical protein
VHHCGAVKYLDNQQKVWTDTKNSNAEFHFEIISKCLVLALSARSVAISKTRNGRIMICARHVLIFHCLLTWHILLVHFSI